MKTDDTLDALLVRYAAGDLSADEMSALQDRLSTDDHARRQLREMAEQIFVIGEVERTAAARCLTTQRAPVAMKFFAQPWRWAAAAVLMVSALSMFLLRSDDATLLEVMEANGTVEWISSEGARHHTVRKGDKVASGTIELSSGASMARLRFQDGTLLTFQGIAEASIFADDDKQVRVKHGIVAANVAPQPAGYPMMLHTPTAEVRIVGTAFLLDVQNDSTGLEVAEGLVRLKRLSDGKIAEVRPGERLVCTLDPAEPLEPRLHVATPPSWSADFTLQPSRLNGIWLPPSTEHPRGAFAAQPLIADKRADGGVTIHHGIIWKSETGFVSLTPKSAIRLKVRTSSPAELQLILSTRLADGTYAGNFEASPLLVPPLAPGQWHELQFTLADFGPTQLDHPQPEPGAIVQGIILNSYQRDVSLEISALEFTP